MNVNVDPAGGFGPRNEPPALAEREDTVSVVRTGGFTRLSPTSFSLWSVPDDPGGRVEIVFQRLGTREVARRLGSGLDGGQAVVGRDVRTEVEELGAVELSRDALLDLGREIDRHLGLAARQDPARDAAASQLLSSTRTELAGMQDRLIERMDALAEKVDASAAGVARVRSQLGRDLEELVRMLWPKDRRGR